MSQHSKRVSLAAFAACASLMISWPTSAWANDLLLCNTLGSDLEVTNSEIGPNGAVVGSISYLPGQFDDGFKSDLRTGDHNIPDNYVRFGDLDLGSQGTIEFWFLPSWVSGGHVRHLFYYGRPDQSLLAMHYNDWQNKLNCGASNGDGTSAGISKYLVPSASPEWSTSEPIHIAVTWDGSTPNPADRLRMYLNGNEHALVNGVNDPSFSDWSDPANALYLSTTARPGDWNRHNWEGADGVIDNIKIWDVAKTDFSDRFDVDCPATCEDIDGDGFGSPGDPSCAAGAEDDCDDLDASSYPGATELCDGTDNDCDGFVPGDEFDTDMDGFRGCEGDCDDANAGANPDALELPGNAVDENCDGSLGACDPTAEWRNHGQFVRCVAHEVNDLRKSGLISQDGGDELVSTAAQSSVGK